MKTSEVLRKALDELNERGWYQGNYVDPDGQKVCAMGAINCAVYGEPDFCSSSVRTKRTMSEEIEATNALDRILPNSNQTCLPEYNDAATTSEEDIKLLFKQAIVNAELEEMESDD